MPHLGSGNVDFNALLAELQLMDGDDIFVFLGKAQKIETLCKRCRLIIPANGLIKKVRQSNNFVYKMLRKDQQRRRP
jgi:hypothetical protein